MKVAELFEAEERSILSVLGDAGEVCIADFYFNGRYLTSLKGAPRIVHGSFFCRDNELTSLKGAPEVVNGNFHCHNNKLTSLEGAPQSVGGAFYCNNNRLTSLEGVPRHMSGQLSCYNNKLASLKGIHKLIEYIGGAGADFRENPIKSHVLGVLRIKGLYGGVALDNKDVSDILNKHLDGDRDIFACQEELIEAGFPEFAQL
jgi:hypothetical protein